MNAQKYITQSFIFFFLTRQPETTIDCNKTKRELSFSSPLQLTLCRRQSVACGSSQRSRSARLSDNTILQWHATHTPRRGRPVRRGLSLFFFFVVVAVASDANACTLSKSVIRKGRLTICGRELLFFFFCCCCCSISDDVTFDAGEHSHNARLQNKHKHTWQHVRELFSLGFSFSLLLFPLSFISDS